MYASLPSWLRELLPIALLLVAVSFVLARLPRVELGHSPAYLRRRRLNWLPLGLTYAFLYMGRYNLTVAKNALGNEMSKQDFADIFFWGTLIYGFSFVINGPLTDRLGGRATIMISAVGSAIANIAMGLVLVFRDALPAAGATLAGSNEQASEGTSLVAWFSVLYSVNMYFQSFGAVSIVKVNAHWFHVRERGTFGGIFGILISLGIYFAYDWGRTIVDTAPNWGPSISESTPPIAWVFYVPAAILLVFAVIDWFLVYDNPSDVGHPDLDTGDASSGDMGGRLPVFEVAKRMFSNPVILTIAFIEFCSGYLRQAIMQWYTIFAKQTGQSDLFVPHNWGLMLCVAGIIGGVFAGVISDRVFGSRRGPVSFVLYGFMLIGSLVMIAMLEGPALGWLMVFMSMCIIGVHGMLSGTASMDFGGKKNAGVAVGIIDGFVYLGTAAQALILGRVLPNDTDKDAAGQLLAADPAQWHYWPIVMIPAAVVGMLLALRMWNALPKSKSSGH
ncbi:MAG: MFS transporter [Planctomycetota bacterium]|nr:MFS transporter [Planctomycetota bacterium]